MNAITAASIVVIGGGAFLCICRAFGRAKAPSAGQVLDVLADGNEHEFLFIKHEIEETIGTHVSDEKLERTLLEMEESGAIVQIIPRDGMRMGGPKFKKAGIIPPEAAEPPPVTRVCPRRREGIRILEEKPQLA